MIEKLLDRTLFFSIHKSWRDLLDHNKKQYSSFPKVENIVVQKINVPEAIQFIQKIQPDLIIVSGTSLLRKEILSLNIPKGIINLHTGLSPYMNGGPNCTNWCIAEKKYHLIGNTIMWIDEGIDSGNIITTETFPLNGEEDLLQLHIKTMDHAHDLYVRAIQKIKDDLDNCPKIKQSSIAAGTTYYTRQWTWKNKLQLIKNSKQLKKYFSSEQYQLEKRSIQTVSLNER